MNDDDLLINGYEVGSIINENRTTHLATPHLDLARQIYEEIVNRYKNTDNHVIIFLYDYDKNINVEYYDSETDIS